MTVAVLAARERIARLRAGAFDNPLQRFAWRHRPAVSALTRRHSRLADLAFSFPALLFALAVPRPRFDPEPVIERVIAGAPLSELAAAADLPMWTRKLGPEAFQRPIPALPDGDMFRRQIANHLPQDPRHASAWLDRLAETYLWGSEAIAVWFAARAPSGHINEARHAWQRICLWAWHCEHPEAPASAYLTARWTPAMSLDQADGWAYDWARSVSVHLYLGPEPLTDMWAEPVTVDGYAFEPVTSALDLCRHAREMQNCARRYGEQVGANGSRIWLMKQDGKAIAMLELAVRGGYPMLTQVHGWNNNRVTQEQWTAAYRWWREYAPQTPLAPGLRRRQQPIWIATWRPYWLAKGRIPRWLPLMAAKVRWPGAA